MPLESVKVGTEKGWQKENARFDLFPFFSLCISAIQRHIKKNLLLSLIIG